MFEAVIADGVNAAVLCVGSQVRDGDLGASSADEGLELGLVKHAQPGKGNDSTEATEESRCLESRLRLQAVSGDVGYVDEAVLVGD